MKVARRSFLGMTSVAALGCGAPAGVKAVTSPPSTTGSSVGRWAQLREQFKLSGERVHLAGLLLASNPKPVREAIDRYQAMLDEDPVLTLEHDFETGEYTNATLDAAARYIGATRDEIALTDSTTSGIAVVLGGLAVERGDDIVATTHDHFVTHETLRLLAERTGVTVRQVPLYDKAANARADAMTAAIAGAITPETRAVVVTWVHSSTGVKTPVRAIADAIARVNAKRSERERILLCVDGVHGFGVENVSMSDLACDFFIAGCHKWIFGPRGTGIVFGRPAAWSRVRPIACPFDFRYVMAREYGGAVPKNDARTLTPGGFRAYEHRWALREAFDLHMALGKADVETRIHELALQCKKGLTGMSHVTLHTPLDGAISSGIVCFEVAGLEPSAVAKRLLEAKIVASTTPYRPSYARFTPGLTNTPEEIERALAAVRQLARAT